MYRERPTRIAGATLWTSTAPARAMPTRVLPDGCLDLLWSSRAGLLVAGPDRTAFLSASVPGERWVGLRLPPGVGPAVLGVPAVEVRDRRVPLGDLWGDRAVGVLADRAATEAEAVLVEVAARRLRAAGGPDPLGAWVAAALAAGATVAATAAEVGLDLRALLRRSRHLFGYGPKTLARILRLRRALALARTGVPLAEVAYRAGYADQAHLTRDTRALTGLPPTSLLTP
ncbi:AraC-type DNA-binding protein [Micromonospora phaseoli]|uniref:AraC-type DNA-binding protein n=1 Tax=Micromonospora phaseoli TaxID=1144548 RepID=A0A1H6Z0I2_9ACTN|nr:helix-turn-helix domain-containing protein [Micromonospora phaseoli]PZW00311.1 AraC family transcriptional regulator [Micromonospora phaseoli]SEJ43040.1 AraC-type DNA-binding protein [Micromonospora phaseoli]